MLLSNVELSQLADFIVEVIECDPEYEADEFAFTFNGVRIYSERYLTHYRLEIGHEDDVIELPRY